jgi:hypothetical protein
MIERIVRQDFKPEEFPLTLEALHPRTRAVVWSTTVEKPANGQLWSDYVPPLKEQLGHEVAMRLRLATGRVMVAEPQVIQ